MELKHWKSCYGKSIEEIKEEFFEQIEDKMKAQKMQQEVTGGVTASPKEVRNFFIRSLMTVSLSLTVK